jgi:hypothetical protein
VLVPEFHYLSMEGLGIGEAGAEQTEMVARVPVRASHARSEALISSRLPDLLAAAAARARPDDKKVTCSTEFRSWTVHGGSSS